MSDRNHRREAEADSKASIEDKPTDDSNAVDPIKLMGNAVIGPGW